MNSTKLTMLKRLTGLVLFAAATALAACNVGDGTTVVEQTDCPTGQTFCGESKSCENLSVSDSNCGACGNACAEGESCVSGTCGTVCPAGYVACDGTCINPLNDSNYCGASEGCADAVACDAGQLCSDGECGIVCDDGLVECDGRCIDPEVDGDFCGAEGNCSGQNAGESCGATEFCDRGSCASGCSAGTVPCDGGCIDPDTDPRFCGASGQCTAAVAGTMCAAGEVCSGGSCTVVCADNRIDCNGLCIDPMTDPSYCGASDSCDPAAGTSGLACKANESCFAGECFVNPASFISPVNTRGTASQRRDTTYTVQSYIPGTSILYTLDGTDPELGGATTMEAASPFVTPVMVAGQAIRFRILNGDRVSDIEQMTHRTLDPAAPAIVMEEMNLDGAGPLLRVAPGQMVNMEYKLEHWSPDVATAPRQAVIYGPEYQVVRCEDTVETGVTMVTDFSDSFMAPMDKGTYDLRMVLEAETDCANLPGRTAGGTVIARVIVE